MKKCYRPLFVPHLFRRTDGFSPSIYNPRKPSSNENRCDRKVRYDTQKNTHPSGNDRIVLEFQEHGNQIGTAGWRAHTGFVGLGRKSTHFGKQSQQYTAVHKQHRKKVPMRSPASCPFVPASRSSPSKSFSNVCFFPAVPLLKKSKAWWSRALTGDSSSSGFQIKIEVNRKKEAHHHEPRVATVYTRISSPGLG